MNLFSRNVVIHSFHGQMVYLLFFLCFFGLFTSVCPFGIKWTSIHLFSLRDTKDATNVYVKRTKKCYSCAVFLFNYIYFMAFICLVFAKKKGMLGNVATNMNDIWIIFLSKSSNFIIIRCIRQTIIFPIITGLYCHLIYFPFYICLQRESKLNSILLQFNDDLIKSIVIQTDI